MKSAYVRMYHAGHAHSVETWKEGKLVGGLYGIRINRVFCGESMFSEASNASKAALIALAKTEGLLLIDCQVYTKHLESMGAKLIPAVEFLKVLTFND